MTARPAPAFETAAQHVGPHPVQAQRSDTAQAVREQIRAQGRSGWELVCVVGDDGRLLGSLTAAGLLALPDDATLGGAMQPNPPRVAADVDQEKMVSIAIHHGVAAMPVVDATGRLVGVVGSTTRPTAAGRWPPSCKTCSVS